MGRLFNDEKLRDLVFSQEAILSLGPSTVIVKVTSVLPAVSCLQTLLIAVCTLLAIASWLRLTLFARAHYSSPILANLIATTMLTSDGEDTKRDRPKYLFDSPEINLTHENGTRTVMTTKSGRFMSTSWQTQPRCLNSR